MRATLVNADERPRLIELVGPPGSGKSTVAEILRAQNNKISVEIFPYFRQLKHTPFFVINFFQLFPELARIFFRNPGIRFVSERDVVLMTILAGWDRALKKMLASDGRIVILEEGAICLFAKLYGFGSGVMRNKDTQEWWLKTYKKWGSTLDTVIQFETPIPMLLKRIRARGQQYEIGDMSDEEACQYLTRIRQAQEYVLTRLVTQSKSLRVVHINTADKRPDQIGAEIVCDIQSD